jgi:predicted glycoside hydrolase/deacetylase ChbG (UPF0249 family)
LHADDFGLNRAISAGIVRGFARGLLTSTALLANAPHAAGALEAWKQLASRRTECGLPSDALRKELDDDAPFDLGVHLNLTQGRPLTGPKYPAELLDGQGLFPGIFRLFHRLQRRADIFRVGLRDELVAQITFLLDHGLRPTHLNGHQYVELVPPVAEVVRELLERYRIHSVRVAVEPALFSTTLLHDRRPGAWLLARVKQHFARHFRSCLAAGSVAYPQIFFGTAHAGRIDAGLMERFLIRSPGVDLIEIGLHPSEATADSAACGNPDGWFDPLAKLRPNELALLESAALPRLLKARHLTLGRLSQLSAAYESTAPFASARTLFGHEPTSRPRQPSIQV